jgi:methylated-DNA-protein-cysteine methyltransferase-like protein
MSNTKTILTLVHRLNHPADGSGDEQAPILPFYPAIWQTVAAIPPGRLATYGQIARQAGLPGYARWVGRALRALPEESRIPWHRVVNSQGRISLPAGSEEALLQVRRLAAEGVVAEKDRYDLRRYAGAGGQRD